MKIIFYGLNFSPELTGIGKYSGEMIVSLSQKNHNTSCITAPPYYPEWKVHYGFKGWSYSKNHSTNNNIDIIRCPLYVPNNPSTIKRLLHLLSFSLSSLPILISKIFTKPDIILTVQPTLFCTPWTLLFAKLTGARSIMHIQDYELDAMFGLGMMKQGLVAKLSRKVETWLMNQFDAISTISYKMIENAVNKGVNKDNVILFPNWADTDFVTPAIDSSSLRQQWGFEQTDTIILYSGNIGKKQGLEIVLDAAKALQRNLTVKFLIVGTGAHLNTLQTQASNMKLDNIIFKPLQPWELVPKMLVMADIHLVIQRKGAADAVLPSKLTNILSAGGHTLVTAENHTELGIIHDKYPDIYTLVEPENKTSFIQALENLLKSDLSSYNKVARNYAEQFLAKETVLQQFESDLLKICNKKSPHAQN